MAPPTLRVSRLWRQRLVLTAVLASALISFAGRVSADQRADFLAAERAIAQGDASVLEGLPETLRDYPLYPYLELDAIMRDPGAVTDDRIERYLAKYPKSPMAARLRRLYLERLAAAGRWVDYARVYRPDGSVERKCLYLRSLIETGQVDSVLRQGEGVWLSGQSRPSACDPVLERWREAGGLTTTLVWQRIRLAMESESLGLARYLGRLLPDGEQVWLARWLAARRDPAPLLEEDLSGQPHLMRAAILADAIAGLAKQSPKAAASALEREQPLLAEDPRALDRASAAVGKALTEQGQRLGLIAWDGMSATSQNLPQQESRLRAAIHLGAWDWVAKWIEAMPDGPEKDDRWLYWLGRADEKLGRDQAARRGYERAAAQRSFWGFMAADKIKAPYHLAHNPTPAAPERIREIVLAPAFARIRELASLGRDADVRREWRALTQGMDPQGLEAAAYVADAFRLHDQAIFTLARADYWDDLELRFPLRYKRLALEQAWQVGIEPEWILAVLRQESVFAPKIASSAGAIGLMQLMPTTAGPLAEELGLSAPSRWDLSDPALSITLGANYLAKMRDRFGHPALATAAYNAGPARVRRWLPQVCTDVDLWIAEIPFAETRRYVERVMTYRVIYAARLGEDAGRLSDWLPAVAAADQPSDARVAGRERRP